MHHVRVESARTDNPLYIGRGYSRHGGKLFGIASSDRLSHVYIIGKTGTGKSTLVETQALHDAAAGRGFALIDPHGDLSARVAREVWRMGRPDVTYFDVPDQSGRFGYNPLRFVKESKRPLAASGLVEIFKKLWADAWGPRLEHILRNAIYALLENKDSKLPDILRLLSDREFRI